MRKRDIDYVIENQDRDEKQALYEKLKQRLNLPDSQPKSSRKRLSMPWKISLASILVLVVCLAITLPIVLKDGSELDRYCSSADCIEIELECTLKDYAEQTGRPLLYVHWYDVSEDTQTFLYTNINNANDMVYMQEMFMNSETGDIVCLFLSDSHTRVDALDIYHNNCTNKFNVKNVSINWCDATTESLAFFEYQGYRYYIEILEGNREDLIRDIVEGMLS